MNKKHGILLSILLCNIMWTNAFAMERKNEEELSTNLRALFGQLIKQQAIIREQDSIITDLVSRVSPDTVRCYVVYDPNITGLVLYSNAVCMVQGKTEIKRTIVAMGRDTRGLVAVVASLEEPINCPSKFYMQRNQLTVVPEDIFAMISIEQLNLDYNCLKELPDKFEDLPYLRVLRVCNNPKLKKLPSSLMKCKFLETVDVGGTSVCYENEIVQALMKRPVDQGGPVDVFCGLSEMQSKLLLLCFFMWHMQSR